MLAINRYMDNKVLQTLFENKANANKKSPEGVVIYQLLFERDYPEGEKIKSCLKCFRRAQNKFKLSKESEEFVKKEMDSLLRAKTMSSIVLPKAPSHVPAAPQPKFSENFQKVDKLVNEVGA